MNKHVVGEGLAPPALQVTDNPKTGGASPATRIPLLVCRYSKNYSSIYYFIL